VITLVPGLLSVLGNLQQLGGARWDRQASRRTRPV